MHMDKHTATVTHQHICKDQVCLHIDTQTQTAPPPKKTATPTTIIQASFTAQGVMGTAGPAGWVGAEASASGVPALLWLPLSPRERTLSFFQHAPLCSPRAVTPSFLHCHLKSGLTLSQQPEPQKIWAWCG